MVLCSCNCRRNCALTAVIVSAILGVIGAFLQISGTITVAPVFLWVTFGIAVVYLAGLGLVTVLMRRCEQRCVCSALNALLAGILGTILFSAVLLAVGIAATSILSAVLVGLLLAFFTLILTASACLIRCMADCEA